MLKGVKKKLSSYLSDVLSIKTSPNSVALGFAIGSFIAITPTPGFSVLIGLLIVFLFRNVSKLALFVALALWNPITVIPFHILSLKIGSILFGSFPVVEYKLSMLDQIFVFSRRYLIGNLVIASFVSIISYFVVLVAVKKIERKVI